VKDKPVRRTRNSDGPIRRSRLRSLLFSIAVCGVCGLLGEALATAQEQPAPAEAPADAETPPAAEVPQEPAPPDAPGEPEVRGPDIPGYTTPPPPDPQLSIEHELITQKDLDWYKVNRQNFQRAVGAADLVGPNRELVKQGFRVLVLRLSLQANRSTLSDVRSEIERRMNGAGMLPGVKPAVRTEFRRFMLDEVIANARLLVLGGGQDVEGRENTGGNLEVRFQAMLLLNQAILEPRDNRNNKPAQFYVPTYKIFLEVLQDQEQRELVRNWAVRGLEKVLELGGAELKGGTRDAIAQALMAELLPGKNGAWLDMRIVEAAGSVGIVRWGGGKPVVVEGLCKVLNDSQRDCLVRSEAARQLGRVPVDASYNLTLFAHETAQLVRDMADEYNQDPKSAKWRICFWNAYTAFVPDDRIEKNARDAGFVVRANLPNFAPLKQHAPYVEEAIQQIAPLVDSVVVTKVGQPLDPALVDGLDTWLKSHRPTDWKPTPDIEPLEVKRVAENPPMVTPAG
jgi:hypothetical protein